MALSVLSKFNNSSIAANKPRVGSFQGFDEWNDMLRAFMLAFSTVSIVLIYKRS